MTRWLDMTFKHTNRRRTIGSIKQRMMKKAIPCGWQDSEDEQYAIFTEDLDGSISVVGVGGKELEMHLNDPSWEKEPAKYSIYAVLDAIVYSRELYAVSAKVNQMAYDADCFGDEAKANDLLGLSRQFLRLARQLGSGGRRCADGIWRAIPRS